MHIGSVDAAVSANEVAPFGHGGGGAVVVVLDDDDPLGITSANCGSVPVLIRLEVT